MIDINELRSVVQRAISRMNARDPEFVTAVTPLAISELLDRLEAVETAWEEADKSCRDLTEKVIPNIREQLESAEKERDALRAKIAAMGRQEPVAFAVYSGWARKAVYLSELEACDQRDRRQLTADLGGSLEAYRVVPLYTSPGAKGE